MQSWLCAGGAATGYAVGGCCGGGGPNDSGNAVGAGSCDNAADCCNSDSAGENDSLAVSWCW